MSTDWAFGTSAEIIANIKRIRAHLKTPQIVFSDMAAVNQIFTLAAGFPGENDPKRMLLNPHWIDLLREQGDELDAEILFPLYAETPPEAV